MSDPMQLQPEERRQFQRFPKWSVIFWHPVPCSAFNVSEAGMGIRTPHRLRVGRIFKFRTRHRLQTVEVLGLVKWCRDVSPAEGQPPTFNVGVCFCDGLSPQARACLL